MSQHTSTIATRSAELAALEPHIVTAEAEVAAVDAEEKRFVALRGFCDADLFERVTAARQRLEGLRGKRALLKSIIEMSEKNEADRLRRAGLEAERGAFQETGTIAGSGEGR